MAKKTKCYFVRLAEFKRISPKCYKAVDYAGNEALIPSSQFYGYGDNDSPGENVYLSAWILEKKAIECSKENPVFLTADGNNACNVPAGAAAMVEHIPDKLEPLAAAEPVPFATAKLGAVFSSSCRIAAAANLINTLDDVNTVFYVCPAALKDDCVEFDAGCRFHVRCVELEAVKAGDQEYFDFLRSVFSTDCLIIDECFKSERPGAKWIKYLSNVAEKAKYKLILNADHPETNVEDIYLQMQFLSPDILKMSYYQFRELYCRYTQFKRGGRVEKTFIDGYSNFEHLR
ncbi:MAG: hypothetical protein IKA32_07650, partial [Lentisphaeria bacterium]|nr:hypothetical protein [Lentisphaeria bacterium]